MSKTETKNAQRKAGMALAVSERVDLKGIRLADFSARCHNALSSTDLPEEMRLSVHSDSSISEDGATLIVKASMGLHVAKPGDVTDAAPVAIEAVFELRYGLNSTEGLTKENYDAFGESNAVFNAWPYWREYVQSATMRLGLPGLTLPLFRFKKTVDVKKSSMRQRTV